MSAQSAEDVTRLAQDLVYKVAYAYYDAPYILLLKLLIQLGPMNEKDLADLLSISTNELRKWMGMLLVHRLVKRYVNKEKFPLPSWQANNLSHTQSKYDNNIVRADTKPGEIPMRIKDVFYWYLDYREFADVVKYRLAIMRKGIDERIRNEIGQQGYICPTCQTTYDTLSISHLFNPRTNSFQCDMDQTELIEHDPTLEVGATTSDSMQRFNLATQPIRDALRSVEGVKLPSVNIVAWIAVNVKSATVVESGGMDGKEEGKFKVVMGGEGERERIERERLAEAQRVQNALPVWHTHSTVTGSATSLGLKSNGQTGHVKKLSLDGVEMDDQELEAHYAKLHQVENGDGDELGSGAREVKIEVEALGEDVRGKTEPFAEGVTEDRKELKQDVEGEEDGEEGMEDVQEPMAAVVNGDSGSGKTVLVGGVAKPIDQVTEEDQDLMTAAEYTAYYEAMEE